MKRFASAAALALLLLITLCTAGDVARRDKRPNIVFVLVDDQDFLLDSYKHMTTLQEQIIQKGSIFTKHYGHVYGA
jgi:N-acetylglucosamine-6-sulfatase